MNRQKTRTARFREPFSYCLNQCAPGGIRTPNLLIRSQMLYPLSYGRSHVAWRFLRDQATT